MSVRWSVSTALVWLCAVILALAVSSAPALAQREHVFSKSFGSEGSGNGQLVRPGALAVNDETGDVYVIDRGNGRVEIFNENGEYVSQFNGSGAPTGAFSWASGQGNEGSIAIDNSADSADLSKGDVYVTDHAHNLIDKFAPNGTYIGQVTGPAPGSPFVDEDNGRHLTEIAVDPSGRLWVQIGLEIDVFNDAVANEYVSQTDLKLRIEGLNLSELEIGKVGFALDSEDNVYIAREPERNVLIGTKFSKEGETLIEKLDGENASGFAVDASSNDVYVDHATSVAAYQPLGTPIEQFGSGHMQASEGIAVSSKTGAVYVSNAGSGTVEAYAAFVVPDTSTGGVSHLSETAATVAGTVDPDGIQTTACVIEYGTTTAYGQSQPCSPSPGAGAASVAITAQLTGLTPLSEYHYRISASNANGSNYGLDRTFVAPEPVALSEENVADVSSTSALLSVLVNPGGSDTTFEFEYGTSEAYGQRAPLPAGDLGAGTGVETASVRVQALASETTYHMRVVATNVLGTVYGPDETFTTQSAGGAFSLPDGRAWEMVSPPIKNGVGIETIDEGVVSGGVIEAAPSGGGFTYLATAPLGSGALSNPAPAGPTQVLATRGPSGWSSQDIATPENRPHEWVQTEYSLFSSDFSHELVDPWVGIKAGYTPLSPEATEATIYIRDNATGSYTPLVTPNDVEPPGAEFGTPGSAQEAPRVLAATPDLSHVLFLSRYKLTRNAHLEVENDSKENLYEWSDGRLQLVNVLHDGEATDGVAKQSEAQWRQSFSSDGSRVFFDAHVEGYPEEDEAGLFMRDTASGTTVEVDAPAPGAPRPAHLDAQFQLASTDGSKAFFLDDEPLTADSTAAPGQPDLYVYETESGSLTDLTVDDNAGEHANVTHEPGEILGASEDGSIVYFVAHGKLAEGAQPGAENLYVESQSGSTWSPPRLVAVLSAEDRNDWDAGDVGNIGVGGLTSRVSPDGRFLAFMSERSLTGYDNRDASSGQPDEEVFEYDEATDQLSCVSCDRTGVRPAGMLDEGPPSSLVDESGAWAGRWLAASLPVWTPYGNAKYSLQDSYPSRALADGGRLFFDSPDALVASDTNGKEDVYEYEPDDVGSCAQPAGCVSLISSGTSSEESVFLDASETGDDVFFLTGARLTAQDVDTSPDVYDAHVCSSAVPCVQEPVSSPPCLSGDSCKAAPSPQPAIYGAPASATFSGAGNVPSPPVGSVGDVKAGAKHRPATKHKPTHHKRPVRRKRRARKVPRLRGGSSVDHGRARR
jgi:hypothetical protein